MLKHLLQNLYRLHLANRVEVYGIVVHKTHKHIYSLISVEANLSEILHIALNKVVEQSGILRIEKLVVQWANRGILAFAHIKK